MEPGRLFQLHATKCKLATTQISPLWGCLKVAGDDSTVGEKLPCMSGLHRPKRSWSGLTNMLAGGFASERRESKPCKDGRVWSIVNVGIYNGGQSVPVCYRHSWFAFQNVM